MYVRDGIGLFRLGVKCAWFAMMSYGVCVPLIHYVCMLHYRGFGFNILSQQLDRLVFSGVSDDCIAGI